MNEEELIERLSDGKVLSASVVVGASTPVNKQGRRFGVELSFVCLQPGETERAMACLDSLLPAPTARKTRHAGTDACWQLQLHLGGHLPRAASPAQRS